MHVRSANYFGPRVATHSFFTHTQKEGRKDKVFTALIASTTETFISVPYVFTVILLPALFRTVHLLYYLGFLASVFLGAS